MFVQFSSLNIPNIALLSGEILELLGLLGGGGGNGDGVLLSW